MQSRRMRAATVPGLLAPVWNITTYIWRAVRPVASGVWRWVVPDQWWRLVARGFWGMVALNLAVVLYGTRGGDAGVLLLAWTVGWLALAVWFLAAWIYERWGADGAETMAPYLSLTGAAGAGFGLAVMCFGTGVMLWQLMP